ncbi:MAG: ribosome silencing factor [Gemmatimonadetes bacterium]|nr:ribosome silencing factor [Gemmatimonadota bacterium]
MDGTVSPPALEFPTEVARAAELALARKATDVVALDLRNLSTATDYFVIGSGASDVQVRSIAEHIIEELEAEGVRSDHVEGLSAGRWVLIDYFDFVVHVFHPSARQFYQLELLWGDAPQLRFEA